MKEIIETIIGYVLLTSMSIAMFLFAWFMFTEWLKEKWLPFLVFAILTACPALCPLAYLFVNLF